MTRTQVQSEILSFTPQKSYFVGLHIALWSDLIW